MSKPGLLVLGRHLPLVFDTLSPLFTVHDLQGSDRPEALIEEVAPDVRAIVTSGMTAIGAELMDRLPALEIIATLTVGYDPIDVAHAARRGVVVTNTPDVLTDEVADLTVALLLATVRELPQADRFLRDGEWVKRSYPFTRASLRGRRVGIIGLGRIGQAVARRLEPFGVSLAYHGRSERPGVPYRYYSDLVAMARDVDTLVSLAPGGAETRAMVGQAVFEALGPDGIFVNVGRGSTVDEPALIEALSNGVILSAGLDVFTDEPRVPQALIDLPNTVLLPHVGSASFKTRTDMAQLGIDNLLAWREGRPVLTPVPETRARQG
jgi:lactate dehydrogenase-like 2-hydroxyacid dehydrogenase